MVCMLKATHVESTPYPTVTDERLLHPDTAIANYRRTYDGFGFSPLNQIIPSNIRRLTLAWLGVPTWLGAHETTPIVNRGRMFITTLKTTSSRWTPRQNANVRYARSTLTAVPAPSDKSRRRALR